MASLKLLYIYMDSIIYKLDNLIVKFEVYIQIERCHENLITVDILTLNTVQKILTNVICMILTIKQT
jgi:hypothetical protein